MWHQLAPMPAGTEEERGTGLVCSHHGCTRSPAQPASHDHPPRRLVVSWAVADKSYKLGAESQKFVLCGEARGQGQGVGRPPLPLEAVGEAPLPLAGSGGHVFLGTPRLVAAWLLSLPLSSSDLPPSMTLSFHKVGLQ